MATQIAVRSDRSTVAPAIDLLLLSLLAAAINGIVLIIVRAYT